MIYDVRQILRLIRLVILPTCLVVPSVNGQEIIQRPDGMFTTEDVTAHLDSLPRNTLILQSAAALTGTIKIQAADQTHLDVVYTKQARTTDRAKAYDFIDLISLNLYSSPDEARIVLRAPNPAPWITGQEAGLVDVTITVPYNCAVQIEALRFDVDAVGPLRGVVVPQSLGQLSVSRVAGEVSLSTANRRIILDNVSGSIDVSTSNESILGRSLTADSVTARFRNEKGEIKLIDFHGSLNVRSRFGRIDLSGLQLSGENSSVSGSSEPILMKLLNLTEGQLVVSNRFENIEIEVPRSLSAYLALSVDDGNIETVNLPVRTELVQQNRLNLIAGEGTVDVRGSIRGSGNILITGID